MEAEDTPVLRFNHVSKTFAAKDKFAVSVTKLCCSQRWR